MRLGMRNVVSVVMVTAAWHAADLKTGWACVRNRDGTEPGEARFGVLESCMGFPLHSSHIQWLRVQFLAPGA